MTIDGINIDNYLLQNVDNGIEYIKADTGNTSDGSYYVNIIAKKKMLKLSIKPLSLTEFATFMADIIKKVKASISSKSEAQRKAQAQLEEATAKLNAANTVDDANELICIANSLPKPMQSAFKKKVAEEMKKLGFVVKDGKFVKE